MVPRYAKSDVSAVVGKRENTAVPSGYFNCNPRDCLNLQGIALNSGRDMEFNPTLLADVEDMLTHSILILI